MKKILIITILSILLYSEINYRMALEAVKNLGVSNKIDFLKD